MDIGEIIKSSIKRPSVFKHRETLLPNYMPKNILYRENQIKTLIKKLTPVFKGNQINIFIYGSPGTGKTLTIKYILKEIQKIEEVDVYPIYVNCGLYPTISKILYKIGSFFNVKNNLDLIKEILREKNVLLVLDEIDKISQINEALYTLTRMNYEENFNLSIIGITNNVRFKQKLEPAVKSALCGVEIIFPPYSTEEIKGILNDRIKVAFKENAVEYGTISYISAYVGYQSGDARLALQILLRAGDLADEEGSSKVKVEHAEKAKDIAEKDIMIEHIKVLPMSERILLYSIAALTLQKIKENPYEEPLLSISEIYAEYYKICEEFKKRPVSERWVRQYVNELELYGYLMTKMDGRGKKIKLLLPAEVILEVLK